MSDGMITPSITVILHLPSPLPYSIEKFYHTLQSVFQQYNCSPEVIILEEKSDHSIHDQLKKMNTESNLVSFITGKFDTRSAMLNSAIMKSKGEFLLYLDNTTSEISLKNSTLATFLLAAERNPGWGLIYSDYDLVPDTRDSKKEIRLLKHHIGRLRDNQDYGRVYFLNKAALQSVGFFDEKIKYNSIYDLRLRISEKFRLIHLSNRHEGALYTIFAEGKGHNVFDYLIAGKESQIEAENILTDHLKRINAYLKPSANFHLRPKHSEKTTLKASIIIPVNNRSKFIGTAIESVLAQTIQDIEVIVVVNGGATDPTVEAVRQFLPGGKNYQPGKPLVRLIVLDINNIGLCLNLGAKAAQGEYYIQLDSDDRLKPDAVEKLLAIFESDEKIGMVIGSYEVWQLDSASGQINRIESIPVVTHDEWTEENGRNNLLRINGAGAPRSIPIQIIKEIGYFGINDEPFARNYGEDYEMVLKISEKYRIGRVWEPIYDVVRHSGGTDHSIDQITIDRNDEAKDFMRMQAILRRQKLNNGNRK